VADPIGGNKLVAAKVTYSPTPHSSYAQGVIHYLDDSLSDYNSDGRAAVDNQPRNIEILYGAYTAWQQSTDSTASATIDIGEARSGDLFIVQGWYGGQGVYRPKAIHLERSDDGSSWTTVDNFTGLTGGSQPGSHGWIVEWDISGEGSRRYWRVTLTHGGEWATISDMSLI
jgi:hypothetical protein